MLPRFLLLLWVPVVVVACFAFVSEHADADEALASWYGPGFSGLPTASGEPYDPYGFTAAHKTMPLGTELLVSYGDSAVEVTVNDRGPYVGERELDLSQGAAEFLGLTEVGVDYVEYASVDQYAVAPQHGSTSQYASADQYSSTAQAAAGTVSTAQYSAEEESFFADQYAVAEQYQEPAIVPQPEVVSAPVPVLSADTFTADASGSVLVVRPGETLSGIAAETGVSVEYLAAQNAIADPNFIYAGQVLYY